MLGPWSKTGCGQWKGPAVGKIKIPYYVVIKGRGYWRTTPRMQALGFSIVRCGPDGPAAWAIASEWNQRWQAARRGDAPGPTDSSQLPRDHPEMARRYPPRSVGAAFQAYIQTPEWAGPRLVGAQQSVVASMASDSGHVG